MKPESEIVLPPSGELRSPQTLAEWQLCRPGDVIRLMGYEVLITEENFEPFMKEIGHFVNWYVGDRLGNWIIPNNRPSTTTKIQDVLTNAYIANGILRTLAKYSGQRVGFFQRMKAAFGGGVPLRYD